MTSSHNATNVERLATTIPIVTTMDATCCLFSVMSVKTGSTAVAAILAKTNFHLPAEEQRVRRAGRENGTMIFNKSRNNPLWSKVNAVSEETVT